MLNEIDSYFDIGNQKQITIFPFQERMDEWNILKENN